MSEKRRPRQTWTHEGNIALLNYVLESDDFEQPTAEAYYKKMQLDLEVEIPWMLLKYKMGNFKCSFKKAKALIQKYKDSDESILQRKLLRTCPYYETLHCIFDRIAPISGVLCTPDIDNVDIKPQTDDCVEISSNSTSSKDLSDSLYSGQNCAKPHANTFASELQLRHNQVPKPESKEQNVFPDEQAYLERMKIALERERFEFDKELALKKLQHEIEVSKLQHQRELFIKEKEHQIELQKLHFEEERQKREFELRKLRIQHSLLNDDGGTNQAF